MTEEMPVRCGDYFFIPMKDDRFAVCQIIWMGSDRGKKFKNIFAFGVLSVGIDKNITEGGGYLSFKDHKDVFHVLFTAVDKLKSGEWPVLGAGEISDPSLENFEFNMAGTLYRQGESVRVLPIEEYQNYLLLSVSGYELIERFLQQY